MLGVGGDLKGPSSPTSLPKQDLLPALSANNQPPPPAGFKLYRFSPPRFNGRIWMNLLKTEVSPMEVFPNSTTLFKVSILESKYPSHLLPVQI